MAPGLASDEIAEDYKNSLEDLTLNSRWEISNLTVIAKEHTEAAIAISRVLEDHINNTHPDRKLPALYVLDSVVKNVGSPYTVILEHHLYQTFMNAYSLVNNQVRKKLDEMLKTWKEPVPGSLDPKPVFRPEATRPIENALIKHRTQAIQQQQLQNRSHHEMFGRGQHIATPPQNMPGYPQPPSRGFAAQFTPAIAHVPNGQHFQAPLQGFTQPYAPVPTGMPNGQNPAIPRQAVTYTSAIPSQPLPPRPQPYQPLPYQRAETYQPPPPNYSNQDILLKDIAALIQKSKIKFAANTNDEGLRVTLKALLDLQAILAQQQLPQHQIQQIRDQVALYASSPLVSNMHPQPPIATTPSFSSHQFSPQTPQHIPQSTQQSSPQQTSHQAPQPPPDLQAMISSNSLADLLRSAAQAKQASISQAPPSVPTPQPQTSQPTISTQTSAGGENSLIAALKAAGMLPPPPSTNVLNQTNTTGPLQPSFSYSTAAPQSTPSLPRPPFPQTNSTLSSLLMKPPSTEVSNEVELTSASIKIPRPHLITRLYEARPNQCSTCGRRFLADDDGKKKKARHLDWHFRTNHRMSDSAKRGQSRSWYVGEMEWIKSKDNDEEDPSAMPNGTDAIKSLAAAAAAKTGSENKYIPVPSESTLANLPCPICHDNFDTVYSQEAQDFVWMDAVRIGNRVYHASCYAEKKKDEGNTPLRMNTPDSVLGKRKAEKLEMNQSRAKMAHPS